LNFAGVCLIITIHERAFHYFRDDAGPFLFHACINLVNVLIIEYLPLRIDGIAGFASIS
jgi:hypothetical protein